jgi:hypothetical protein
VIGGRRQTELSDDVSDISLHFMRSQATLSGSQPLPHWTASNPSMIEKPGFEYGVVASGS